MRISEWTLVAQQNWWNWNLEFIEKFLEQLVKCEVWIIVIEMRYSKIKRQHSCHWQNDGNFVMYFQKSFSSILMYYSRLFKNSLISFFIRVNFWTLNERIFEECSLNSRNQWNRYVWLKVKKVKEETQISMVIFDHSKSGGHFTCSFQIPFSSIPTIEATILKNSLY